MYISRDLDSIFTDREYEAVQEWLDSDASIHVMRDHPRHVAPMVGCAWGTKLFKENIRTKWKKSWENGLEDNNMYADNHAWGPDQEFLEE